MSASDEENRESTRLGPNAHIVDQLIGSDRKRNHGEGGSSLDYKPEDDALLVHPPRPGEEHAQQHHAASEESTHDQPQQRAKIATRARGSSGIPPPGKLELSDLKGMTEEEIMRALYEDPELAAAAAALQDQEQKVGGTEKIAGDRLDELKERGIPVGQWIVLLALLGVMFWQIYKSLNATATKPLKGAGVGNKNKAAPKPKAGKAAKGKKQSAERPSNSDVNHRNKKPVEEKQPTDSPIESFSEEKPVAKGTDASAPSKENKKKARKTKNAKKGKTDAGNDEPVSTPVEEPVSTPVEEPEKPAPIHEVTPTLGNKETTNDKENDAGWKTVGATETVTAPETVGATETVVESSAEGAKEAAPKKKKAKKKKAAAQKEAEIVIESTPKEVSKEEPAVIVPPAISSPPVPEPPVEEPEITVEPVVTVSQEAAADAAFTEVAPAKAKKAKKKKKQAEKESNGQKKEDEHMNGGDDKKSTDGDAALALQLQQQEEERAKEMAELADRLAASEEVKEEPKEDWAKVKTKKRKAKAAAVEPQAATEATTAIATTAEEES